MKPYLAILSARFRMMLQYRAAAAAGFVCQLFWGLIRMMIFQAFYENADATAPMTEQQVTTYVWLGQAFLMLIPFRSDHELVEMIRTGNVAYEMLRPVDLYTFWYARAVAGRVAMTVLRAAPMLIVATLMGWLHWPGAAELAAFAAAIIGAVLLGASIWVLMTITMFWTIAGEGISNLASGAMFLLSGMIVPLPLFPDWMQPVLNILPFRGICDVPHRIFAGNIPPSALPGVLMHQLAWAAGLVLFGRWLLARGTRRLVVQGG